MMHYSAIEVVAKAGDKISVTAKKLYEEKVVVFLVIKSAFEKFESEEWTNSALVFQAKEFLTEDHSETVFEVPSDGQWRIVYQNDEGKVDAKKLSDS